MSMWRIGREAVGRQATRPTPLDYQAGGRPGEGPIGDLADTVAKWIPGEVLALYVAGVTMIGSPNWFWLVVGILLAPLTVVLSAFANSGQLPDGVIGLRAVLGLVAMVLWTLAVPGSGWQNWSVIGDNPAAGALFGAVLGLIFGLIAEGVTRYADNRPAKPAEPDPAPAPVVEEEPPPAVEEELDEPTETVVIVQK